MLAPRNQTREPTPAVIPVGALWKNSGDSVTTPSVVIEAILLALNSVNKRLFELPGRMIVGVLGVWKIVISTVGVTRATSETKALEIQMLPSGPAAMELGEFTPLNSVITPLGVILPNLSTACSVNHMLPSAPVVMSPGKEFGVGVGNSAKMPVERLYRLDADLISTSGVPSNASIGPIFTHVPSISRTSRMQGAPSCSYRGASSQTCGLTFNTDVRIDLMMARPSLRHKILRAGLPVMFRSGYHAASVRDICAAAGAPQGSFTNHFRSKEAFAVEVLNRYFDYLKDMVAAALTDETLTPRQRLRRYLDVIT